MMMTVDEKLHAYAKNQKDRNIDEKKLPESWVDRNLKQMKDMICHNPIIAFSAR